MSAILTWKRKDAMLLATTMGEETRAARVCGPEQLIEAQGLVRRIPVGEKVRASILKLVRAARPEAPEGGIEDGATAWGLWTARRQAPMLAVARAGPCWMAALRLRQTIEGPWPRRCCATPHGARVFTARAGGLTTAGVIERLCRGLLERRRSSSA